MLKKYQPVLIMIILLVACSSQPSTEEDGENENDIKQVGQVDEVDKDPLKEEQSAVTNHFEEMIKMVDANNQEKFLSYQDETNKLFYKEQEGWLRIINQKKQEGWETSVIINDVTLDSLDEGSLEMMINMKREDQDISNHITYPIKKINDTWKMSDLPFEKIADGPINLYYLPSLKRDSEIALADINEIVDLYSQTFGWEPEEINIKLYDSVEEISASTGWPSLYGVTVPFTSLKFVVEGNYEIAYGFMKHEIVHTMLADISNDNAPPFLQEGLATFISDAVTKDDSGQLQLDFKNTMERERLILDNTEEIKPIVNLKDSDYTNDSIDIYNVGFLITDYLIQTYGIEKYLEMVKILKSNGIIENNNPEREQIVFLQAINALEETYGPLEILSEDYIEHFNKIK